MKKRLASPLASAKNGLSSIVASLICIAIGLAVGYLLLMLLAWLALNQEVAEGIRSSYTFDELIQIVNETGFMRMIQGGFYEGANLGGMGVRREIIEAAPLIMTGLSVAFAFKTGLFNIGAAGQYTLGAYGALYSALILQLPWWACLIIATLCGAIWGAIPGVFKAFLNVNEVITSIMVNWIGLYGVNTLIYQKAQGPMYNMKTTKTWTIKTLNPDGQIPTFNIKNSDGTDYFMELFGLPTISIFIAIAVAIVIWFIISKTTFGYELKACGHNKDAAKYAGINEKKNIILSMVIAGALAGLGAGLFYLSGTKEWEPMNSNALPAAGFNGISVALLASSNPLGTIFSALFISHISVGGSIMNASYFPGEVADIISGVVIYLCAFSLMFRTSIMKLLSFKPRKKKVATQNSLNDGKENEN